MSLTSSFAAGSAGGFVVIVTAVVSSQAYSRLTAQGKVEALERLHQLVRERHQHFVDKMLIRLQPTHSDNVQFQGSQVITDLLDSHRSTLDELKGEVSRAGYYRWSPTFKRQALEQLERELNLLDEGTLTTSASANAILAQLRREQCATIMENYNGQSTTIEVRSIPESSDGSNFPSGGNISLEKENYVM